MNDGVMSVLGQTRRFGDVGDMSGLPQIVLQNPVVFVGDCRPGVLGVGLSRFPIAGVAASRRRQLWLTHLLRRASSCKRWWGTPEQLDEPLQILRGCGEQYLVSRPAQTSQPKPVKPEDALHVCKPHLYLFALAA